MCGSMADSVPPLRPLGPSGLGAATAQAARSSARLAMRHCGPAAPTKSAPAEKVPPSAANTMIHASMSAPRTSNARMQPSFYFVTSSFQ